MHYALQIFDDENGGFYSQFRDFPQIFGSGETIEAVKQSALEGLLTALEYHQDERRAFPLPSLEALAEGEVWIELPAQIALKIYLYNECLAQSVTKAEMARRLGCLQKQIDRLWSPYQPTKLDTFERAFKALNKALIFQLA